MSLQDSVIVYIIMPRICLEINSGLGILLEGITFLNEELFALLVGKRLH
jgi:hypothetical protein